MACLKGLSWVMTGNEPEVTFGFQNAQRMRRLHSITLLICQLWIQSTSFRKILLLFSHWLTYQILSGVSAWFTNRKQSLKSFKRSRMARFKFWKRYGRKIPKSWNKCTLYYHKQNKQINNSYSEKNIKNSFWVKNHAQKLFKIIISFIYWNQKIRNSFSLKLSPQSHCFTSSKMSHIIWLI